MPKEVYREIQQHSRLLRSIIGEIATQHLAGTAFVEDKPFTPDDTQALLATFVEAAPFADHRVYPDYWDHIIGVGLAAEEIAKTVNDPQISPEMIRSVNIGHDAGRLVTPHLYYRNDLELAALATHVGVLTGFENMLHPVPRVLGRGEVVKSIDDLTLSQIIADVADNIMKFDLDGNLLPLAILDTRVSGQSRRYANFVVPSTRWGLRQLENGKQEFSINLFHEEVTLLQAKYGIDIQKVRNAAWQRMQQPDIQFWLWAVKEAQESLDSEVDARLGRHPIQTVIFDMGSVLVEDADPPLWQILGGIFDRNPAAVAAAVGSLNDVAMPGNITPVEYTKTLRDILGLTLSHGEMIEAFNQPSIYTPVPGMQAIVSELSQHRDMRLAVLSDCHEVIAKPSRRALTHLYPEFDDKNIFFSSEIKTSKRIGGEAFSDVLGRLGNPEPSSVLFIDDNKRYTTAARAKHNIRAFTFQNNSVTGRRASDRLAAALALQGGTL